MNFWCDIKYSTIRAENESSLGKSVAYVVDGVEVESPGILNIYLWSTGKKDIKSDDFDRELPVVLDFGVEVFDELEGGHESETDRVDISLDAHGQLSIQPSLIRKRFAKHYRLLVSGNPYKSIVSNPVANMKLHSFYGEWSKKSPRERLMLYSGRMLLVAGFGTLALSLLLQVFGVTIPAEWREWALENTWSVGLFGAVIAGGLLLTTFAALPSRKSQRAVRILRRSTGVDLIPWSRTDSSGTRRLDLVD